MKTDIEEELDKIGVKYFRSRNRPYEIQMHCFSGSHEDKDPSMNYNIIKEVFNCFSCGHRGSKRDMFAALGISVPENLLTKQGFKIEMLKHKLESKSMTKPVELPPMRVNWLTDFRGISANTMKEFEAFSTDHAGMEDYVWIPLYQMGKLIGVDGRHRLLGAELKKPKYIRLPRGLDLSELLFPIDKIEDKEKIILVEGMYDMLKLWDLGIKNAVTLLGANAFSYKKARVLSNYGVKHVTILMDGDAAGRKAAPIISNLLSKNFIDSSIVDLEDNIDPGVFTKEHLETYLSNFILD